MPHDLISVPCPFSPRRLLAIVAVSLCHAASHVQAAIDNPAPPPTPAALAHVALRTTDIERTLIFYRDYLGFTERFRTDQVPGKPNVYYKRDQPPVPREGRLMLVDLRLGEQHTLELFAGREPGQPVLHHLALRMSDLGATRDALERHGVKVPPAPAPKAFFVNDPSGQTLELVSPPSPANARPPGSPKPSLQRIHFVVLPIKETEASAPFYQQALGLGEEFLAIGQDGKPAEQGEGASRQLLLSTTETEPQACLGVFDLETFHARLQSEAVRLGLNPPPALEPGPHGERFFELHDPDGFRLRFVELPDSKSERSGNL